MNSSERSKRHHGPAAHPHPAPAKGARGSRRSKNNLVALGSAAVLAVYAAGYFRTRSAAQRFAEQEHRRPGSPERAAGVAATMPPSEPTAAPSKPLEPAGAIAQPLTAKPVPPPASAPAGPAVVAPVAIAETVPLPPSPPAPMVPAPVAPVTTPPSSAVPVPSPIVVAPVVPPAPASAVPGGNAPGTATTAPIASAVAAQPEVAAPVKYKDGTYSAWGHCRHGDLEATVEIKGGRIYAVSISKCLTRYSCDVIDILPGQAIARQSAEVDIVTGATQSSDAFYDALVAALKQAIL